MARVFPQAAISSPYMSTERETFTVWMKSLVYQNNGLTVYNSSGEITYRVETYDKSSNEVHIMDLHGNILFTIRKKKLWLFGSWYVYRECESYTSTEEVKPSARIKRSSIRDGDWEVRDETNEVFWILRFDPKFAFQIIDINGDIIAQLKPKQSSNGITLGEDVLTLEVKPRVDHSLVVALVTVYGLIKGVV
ncbi:PREDICTED: protein LURP-one-related 4-like [Camelina sativa]|uniref:Protein LURP-one-related 4-like n=1 Tax=Camelina sativa TaxID=90675 RepID=A0ABM0WNA2_CAMSA|nr:PREDICTED: protein LURP-one-related 4-like [Camelina sativa]